MGLKRQINRNSLKDRMKEAEEIIRDGRKMNSLLNTENQFYQNKVNTLQSELRVAKDVIVALAITDIRNHNFTCYENKKQIAVPYSFLIEVSKKYRIVMQTLDDTLVIEPVEIPDESADEVEGNTADENSEGVDVDEGAEASEGEG